MLEQLVKLARLSVDHPKTVTGIMIALTVALALVAALPSLWPETFSALHPAVVDTDPENMLSEEEPVRIFHNQMRKELSLYDIVVLGVVNEKHPEGVFNTESLRRIYDLTEYAKKLRWPDEKNPEVQHGVIEIDLIAPSTVDNIEQAGLGTVRFEWLMPSPPKTEEEALAIRRKAERLPFLNGTVLSEDGKALALYIPITSKDLSSRIAEKLQEKTAEFGGEDRFFITGLPVAEDTFGVEMFKQMAISAPLAMLVIFLLMLVFFRKLILILSPMIVAMVSVICTMGLLIATGNTIHIMSSMIPIFIMPIAVLDSIHILSEFFDRYQETRDRRATILKVMRTLSMPMLFTSLTTAAGFASLALTPIPPVQVFGVFVTFGVLMAWIWTVAFIPAFIMLIPQRSLENFGLKPGEGRHAPASPLDRILGRVGRATFRHAKLVMAATALVIVLSIYGIYQIRINDNPIKWFNSKHPIRIADRVLNEHFGGTYMGYLALAPAEGDLSLETYFSAFQARFRRQAAALAESVPGATTAFAAVEAEAHRLAPQAETKETLIDRLIEFADRQAQSAPDNLYDAWDETLLALDREKQLDEVFKQPELLRYVETLQAHLLTTGVVGKSNSLADIVKTVYRELLGGESSQFRIPDTSNAVAQTLITYQNSHRPNDLWHFVTPDYRTLSVWVQLKSGDNMDMTEVVGAVDKFFAAHPPPIALKPKWFGLTYINVVWQEKMVSGMLQSFLGSFLVVLLMMTALFRSSLWGLLSMIPLTVTIGLIYGVIGLVGKDYDMPVAVLSSLSLGLAVDYAIHFLQRSRSMCESKGSWKASIGPMFGEPARAITRNVIVIGIGFLPLLAAPLVPYQTVGFFIAAILLAAGAASLLILPALITLLEPWLFPQKRAIGLICQCATCVISAVVAVAVVAVNVHQFLSVGYTKLTSLSIVVILVLLAGCCLSSKRKACNTEPVAEKGAES